MATCNPCATPIDTKSKLSSTSGAQVHDATLFRSLVGALQYLTLTRPDISYVVQQACLFMHSPREPHLNLVKRILRYVHGTIAFGLLLLRLSSRDLVAYSDADWAGYPDTRRSTFGYCVYLVDNFVSWSSKRQATISRSSVEAEYHGVANAVVESCWLRQLLVELHQAPTKATVVYCDNVSATYLASNPEQHQHTKHVELICILCAAKSLWVRSRCSMVHLLGSLQMYSPKARQRYCFLILELVFTFIRNRFRLRGAVSETMPDT